MITSAQQSIMRQRDALSVFLKEPLMVLATACAQVWDDVEELEHCLRNGLVSLPYCDHVTIISLEGIQLTADISAKGDDRQRIGVDRSHRPYLNNVLPLNDFVLSESYISEFNKRPSVTAVQIVKRDDKPVGFVSAYFDLRDLPLTAPLYEESRDWQQMKGDPSIRSALFYQNRVDSVFDQHVDTVISILEELIINHGIFHCDMYFSSNRATVWSQSDPYRYRILTIDELIDPDVCLTFPRTPYPENAVIPSENIIRLLRSFRDLRFTDETIYLRIASLNIFNGMVGLTFSCDGSHSIFADEFLQKGLGFWIGCAEAGSSTIPAITQRI